MAVSARLRSALLALLAATIAVGVAACRKSHTTTVVHDFHLAVSFRSPVTGKYTAADVTDPVAGVCGGTRSWLLSFDPSGAGPYTKRFLMGLSGQLFGCGGGVAPCAGSSIATTISSQARVMVEGLSVTTSGYLGSKDDVVCRGVADPSIDATSLQALSPTSLAVRFDLLRVGDFDGMFAAGGPAPRYGAATLEIPEPVTARTTTGGIVVVGGGDDGPDPRGSNGSPSDLYSTIWLFDPRTLSFSSAATLSVARDYLTATAYWAGTVPTVLFAGGQTNAPSARVESYVVGSSSTATMTPLLTSRAAPLAVYLPSLAPSGAQAVVFIGGCDQDGDNFDAPSATLRGNWEIYSPIANTTKPGPVPFYLLDDGPVASICYGAGGLTVGTAGQPLIWFSTGYVDTASNTVAGRVLDATWWTIDLRTTPGTYGKGKPRHPGAPRRSAASVTIGTEGIAVFGGSPNFGGNYYDGLDDWFYYRPGLGAVAPGIKAMSEVGGRDSAAAAQLLDGRIVVAGGTNDTHVGGTATVDVLEPPSAPTPAVFSTGWTFAQGARAAPPMSEARFGHTVTRVDGTRSWLNGSLLVVGLGSGGSNGAPELFVPAYECGGANGDEPIRLTDGASLSQLGLVDACDRARIAQPLSDPLKP